jgi:hypothetical protein
MFHSKKPEGFHRYRVADTTTLQVLSAKPLLSKTLKAQIAVVACPPQQRGELK